MDILDRLEDMYTGKIAVFFREEEGGKWIGEGRFISSPDHAWYEHVKKLAISPVVIFNKGERTITLSRQHLSVYEGM